MPFNLIGVQLFVAWNSVSHIVLQIWGIFKINAIYKLDGNRFEQEIILVTCRVESLYKA